MTARQKRIRRKFARRPHVIVLSSGELSLLSRILHRVIKKETFLSRVLSGERQSKKLLREYRQLKEAA